MTEIKSSANRRVTIREVAARAGVSVSAVSKVIRDAYGVSASLRHRVESAMDVLGYRPLASARGMRGRTYTVGLALPDIRNPFFADILNGMTLGVGDTKYQCIISVGEASGGDQEAVRVLLDRQVDGLVFLGAAMEEEAVVALARKTPLVAIGYHAPQANSFDTVNGDDISGARTAVRHLIDCGYTDIAMMSLEGRASNIVSQRELGYRIEMMESGLGASVNVSRAPNGTATLDFLSTLVASGRGRSAVFCWCDMRALEVMGAAKSLSISVPEALGIVGYDNSLPAGLPQNDITSVSQSGAEIGKLAAKMLVQRIEGRDEAMHVSVATDLVVRGTTSTTRGRNAVDALQ